MKKALLFIGLAMCTTIAFAQTNNYAKPQKKQIHEQVQTVDLKQMAMQNADYKASIFTKAAGDTLAQWHFNSTAEMTGIVYGENGYVTAGMTVAGEALPENGASHPSARWNWIPDSAFINQNNAQFAATYPELSGNWWGMARNLLLFSEDDGGGCMLMSLIDILSSIPDAGTPARDAERPHAFFALPSVARPAADRVIDIAYHQVYRKFYDQTFIDYKIAGQWQTREINVDGVDASINSFSRYNCRYVMPLALGNEANIEIRFRYLGGVRSDAWGYMWGVDDVCIISGGNNRWTADAEEYVAGAYGTVPQGMELPLTWAANMYNAGYYNATGVEISASHIAQDGTATNLLTVSGSNIPAGDPSAPTAMYINEQGLVDPTDPEMMDVAGWFDYGDGYMAESPVAGYQYRGIPATTLGRNRVTVTATADSNLSMEWDTIAYRVVGYSTIDDLSESNTVEGYRWGHDNGILAAGNSYHYGMTANGQYVTEDGNWNQATYAITSRYTTGMTIPTDPNGDPWVLRGVELVTAPDLTADDLDGAKIRPVTYVDVYSEDGVSFYTLDNGVNNVVTTINGEEANNYMATNYGVAVEDGYQAVSIFFPMQPELEPNTSYRVGYRLASTCQFAVGETSTSYQIGTRPATNPNDDPIPVWQSYDSSAVTAAWRHQFWPNTYDITIADPMHPESRILWGGYYHEAFPMIRAIVGPREQLPNAEVRVICDNDGRDYTIEYNDSVYCQQTLTIPETSGPTFYIIPAGNGTESDANMILDSLFVDGQYVALPGYDSDGDDDFVAHDYSTYDTVYNWWNSGHDSVVTNLERYYWTYTFRDIHGSHTIRAHAHFIEWTPTGVDPVAPEAKMVLAPNPAASQVALSVNGVNGMVNCSIIDMSGRVVYNNTINAETTTTIDLRNVPAGAYFVRITNDTFSKVEKLIVR